MCKKEMTAPFPQQQTGRLPQGIKVAQRNVRDRERMGGRDRKEGKVTEVRKDGKHRSDDSGWAWGPLSQGQLPFGLLADLFPQPSPRVLSPCNSGSRRKWLNPMYFYTEHTPVGPAQIITLYM